MLNPQLLLCGGDFLLAYAAFALADLVRLGFSFEKVSPIFHSPFGILGLAITFICVSYFAAMYRRGECFSKWQTFFRCLAVSSITFMAVSEVFYLFSIELIERSHLILTCLFFFFFQFVWHCRCHLVLGMMGLINQTLILGEGELAAQVAALMGVDYRGERFLGYVATGGGENKLALDPVLGHVDQIERIAEEKGATQIIIALSERRGTLPVRDLLACKLKGIKITDAVAYIEQVTGKLILEHINPSWFVFSDGSHITPSVRIVRRSLDLLFSVVGIAFSLPVLPFVALAVKLDSPGPVIFKQVRVGEGNKNFHIYKFRTMRQDAEKLTGAVWATAEDPRITKVGNFLRKTRLDEIPQLFNVFKGDMSFVGPRPERPEFVRMLEQEVPYYGYRHYIKPGLTGWAQVRYAYGASVEDALAKLRFDLYYIKNYTVAMDIIIIFETIRVVLLGRGR